MSVSEERGMLPHIKKEHIESIKDKYIELNWLPPHSPLKEDLIQQLLKAIAVYIVKRDGPYE